MSQPSTPVRHGVLGSLAVLSAFLILILGIAALFWASGEKRGVPVQPPQATAGTASSTKTVSLISEKAQRSVERGTARVLLPDGNGSLLPPELAETARELNAPDSTIQRDFEILDTLLDFFRKFNGGVNPQGGEIEEIVVELSGQKGKLLAVLPPDHPFINSNGELLDRWGTPFHFHPVDYDTLEIRSAGPDHKLWTADDVMDGVQDP